ncbi:autoinducer-binding protein [Mesorhizobium huakuii]|uniref:helix-turn-helix transcriptional regulator n=1 Tax=Mesorhizobium TaxID=68287 RepID=UPI001F0B5EA4|nr:MULTISPECIES: LuxR family transcriptional regulator [Mesorhizobium]MCH4561463.1 LuxR family transcriptional regulator [Mesorhizobium jarvisii]GLQ77999.1 autoinducer-binding protein [Mesorhizobium huakuii]
MEATAFDFVERCQGHKTPKQVLDDLLFSVGRFGFEHLILSGVPVGDDALEPLVELNGWPKSWFRRYSSQNYARVDAVCRYCKEAPYSFFWSDVPERLRDCPKSKRVASEAAEFGLVSGYVVLASSRLHWQTVVSFASPFERIDLSKRELIAITVMSLIAVSSVEALRSMQKDSKLLSPREKEVLLWAARGRTAEEIANILSISVTTVRKHLQQARRTFGVSTTMGAVAEALRLRQVMP